MKSTTMLIIAALFFAMVGMGGVFAVTQTPVSIAITNCSITDVNGGLSAACGDTVRVSCNVTVTGTSIGDEKITRVQYQVGNTMRDAICNTTSTCVLSGGASLLASSNAIWTSEFIVGYKENALESIKLSQVMAISSSGVACSGSGVTTKDRCYVGEFMSTSVAGSCTCGSTTTTGEKRTDNTVTVTTTPGVGCQESDAVTSVEFADYCDPKWVPTISACAVTTRNLTTAPDYENVMGRIVKTYESSNPSCCAATASQAGHLWFNHNTGSDCDKPVDNALSLGCKLDAWPGFQQGDWGTGVSSSTNFGKEGYVKYSSTANSLWQPLAADIDNDGETEIIAGGATALSVLAATGQTEETIAKNVVGQPAIFGIFIPTFRDTGENAVVYNPYALENGSLIVVPVNESGVYYVKAYDSTLSEVSSSISLSNPPSGVACGKDNCYFAVNVSGRLIGFILDPLTGADSQKYIDLESTTSGGSYTGIWSMNFGGLVWMPGSMVPKFFTEAGQDYIVWSQLRFAGGTHTAVDAFVTEMDGDPVRRFTKSLPNYLYVNPSTRQLSVDIPGGFVYGAVDHGLYVAYQERYNESGTSRMGLGLVRFGVTTGTLDVNARVSAVTDASTSTVVWDAESADSSTEGVSNVVMSDLGYPVFRTYTLKTSDPLGTPVVFSPPTQIGTYPIANPFGVAQGSYFIGLSPDLTELIVGGKGGYYWGTGTQAFTTTEDIRGVAWEDHTYVTHYVNSGCGMLRCYSDTRSNVCDYGSFGTIVPTCIILNGGRYLEDNYDTSTSAAGYWNDGDRSGMLVALGKKLDSTGRGWENVDVYLVNENWGAGGYNTSCCGATYEQILQSKSPYTGVYHEDGGPFNGASPGVTGIGGIMNARGPTVVDGQLVGIYADQESAPSRFYDGSGCVWNGNVDEPRFICADGKKYKYSEFSKTAGYTVTTKGCNGTSAGYDFKPLVYHSDRYILGYFSRARDPSASTRYTGPELAYCDFSDETDPVTTGLGTRLYPNAIAGGTEGGYNFTSYSLTMFYQRRDGSEYYNFDKVLFYGRVFGSSTVSKAQTSNTTAYPMMLTLWDFDMSTETPIDMTYSQTTQTREMVYNNDLKQVSQARGTSSTYTPRQFITEADVDGDGGYEVVSGRTVSRLSDGTVTDYSFSSSEDAWVVPVDVNSDGSVDMVSADPAGYVASFISTATVNAVGQGPAALTSLRCAVMKDSGLTKIQMVGQISNPDDIQIVIDPGDGTGSYFPDVSLNGQYQYSYAKSGNYTLKMQLFASQNVFDVSSATCDVSVSIPYSSVEGSAGSGKCSLGLDGEFSYTDDVLNHGWIYDGGALVPASGIVNVKSGKSLQHTISGCEKTIQTAEFKISANDGELRILSGTAQIAGIDIDTNAKVLRDMNGRSLGMTVTAGSDLVLRFVIDREKGKTYVYSESGQLLTTYNATGELTGVLVRGPMIVDYVRVSDSGSTVLAPSVDLENIDGDTTKLEKCRNSNIAEATSREARMSYPNVGAYCASTVNEPAKRCDLTKLMTVVRIAPSCSKEAYNYCISVAMPKDMTSIEAANATTLQGATACSVLLTGTSMWQGIVRPTASNIWAIVTSNMTVLAVIIVILVLVIPLYVKAKGR